MLDSGILSQVKGLFSSLVSKYEFVVSCSANHPEADTMIEFVDDFTSCSENLSYTATKVSSDNILEFAINKEGVDTGIKFRGIPNGHEFTSLLLAVLNADGKGKNLPDSTIIDRIRAIKGEIKIQTYVSLTCTNCPDVVQALNIIALYNPNISHEMVDGGVFSQEVDSLKIQAVPSVYANGKPLHVGRGELGELLQKLEDRFGIEPSHRKENIVRNVDLIVLGGGPAGVSSAIYSARKGLRVAVVAERIGGQVKETVGIENVIATPYITGEQLAASLRTHMEQYSIEIFEQRKIESAELSGRKKRIQVVGGEIFTAPAVIIATGAGWKRLNVEGESEYIGRGVAFCPHCDGPFYKDKHVAVIGGGNSGIEAAIDLAGICSKVTVLEFADSLKADTVLQNAAQNLHNVEIFTSSQTTQIIGNGEKVTAIKVKDRISGAEKEIELDGIFIQIGLSANSLPFRGQLETTPIGEIKIDAHCRTSLPGVYAAGDVSSVPFKQIVIAMGEGAKAALSAFEDKITNKI